MGTFVFGSCRWEQWCIPPNLSAPHDVCRVYVDVRKYGSRQQAMTVMVKCAKGVTRFVDDGCDVRSGRTPGFFVGSGRSCRESFVPLITAFTSRKRNPYFAFNHSHLTFDRIQWCHRIRVYFFRYRLSLSKERSWYETHFLFRALLSFGYNRRKQRRKYFNTVAWMSGVLSTFKISSST